MIKLFARSVVTLFLLLELAGCATGKLAGSTVHIALLPDGRVSVDGNKVEIAKVGKRLTAMGATSTTAIVVSVPNTVSNGTRNDLFKNLMSAGFQRVSLATPVKVEATVSNPNSPTPAAPAVPAGSSRSRTSTSQRPVRSGTL